jgi:hypothetical protein
MRLDSLYSRMMISYESPRLNQSKVLISLATIGHFTPMSKTVALDQDFPSDSTCRFYGNFLGGLELTFCTNSRVKRTTFNSIRKAISQKVRVGEQPRQSDLEELKKEAV